MQETIDFEELEKSLGRLRQLTEKIDHTLININTLVKDNINSGRGIWDSELALMYRTRWDVLMEEFPTILGTFRQQETNLENYINNMKKVEER